MTAIDGLLAAAVVLSAVGFTFLSVKARAPSAGAVLYSATHYGGQRAVLPPGSFVPPFQPASLFVPVGLSLVMTLSTGISHVTVGPGSSVSVFQDVLAGSTVSSVTVTTNP